MQRAGLVGWLALAACQRAPVPVGTDAFPILTPPAPLTPRLNGAKLVGVRPGAPFFFQIPATGERPMSYDARDLPSGLALDRASGLITGRLDRAGRCVVTLMAHNRLGSAERACTIVVGEQIALTPPMGWNSWNCWGGQVSQVRVDAAARALVSRHLVEHGWSYVNIDDGWQGVRGGPTHALQPNRKFPDIAGLATSIHARGLKFGLYSTPWRTSYYAHIGSSADHADGTYDWIQSGQHTDVDRYRFNRTHSWLSAYAWLAPLGHRFEKKRLKKENDRLRTFGKFSFARPDAQQWAAWGVDYLKYDWDPTDLPHIVEMRDALRATGRDVVYSLANDVDLTLAPQLTGIANVWRGTIDVHDKWRDLEVGFRVGAWAPFTGPGHYNDPDMLVIGRIGWDSPRPTALTSDEQYTQVSLWCLLAAPLFLGCDLDQLDPFTLGLITNDEVLAIDQDTLGRQATQVSGSRLLIAFGKPLDDGSWAVGLFNRSAARAQVAVKWSDLHETGSRQVRDLWRQRDLGVFADGYAADVAPHGVVLLRVSRPATR